MRILKIAALAGLMGSTAAAGTLTDGKPYQGTVLKALLVKSSQFEAQQAHLQEFADKTGIEVQIDYVPFPNMREALSAEMIGGTGYDIVAVMDQWVQSMDMLLAPIDEMVDRNKLDLTDYPKAHLDHAYINGELSGLPIRGHIQLMFYRKDLLDAAGVQAPTTWESVSAIGKAIKEKTGVAGIALPYGKLNGQNLMVWYNLLWGHGGDVIDAEGKPLFNSEAGVKATTQYIDYLRKDGIVSDGAAIFTEQDAVNSFKQGNSAMLPVWWWVRSQLTDPEQSKLTEAQIGFTTMPAVTGHPPTTYTNTWYFGITEETDKREAAMEFLSWVSDPALEKQILLDPSLKEVVAVHKSNLNDPEVNARWGGMHEAAALAIQNSPTIPYGPDWPRTSEVLETAISSLASGGSDNVAAALDKAAAEIGGQ